MLLARLIRGAVVVGVGLTPLAAGSQALGAAAPTTTPAGPVDDAAVDRAVGGLTIFSIDTLNVPPTVCPTISQEALATKGAAIGAKFTSQGYAVESYWSSDVDALVAYCGVSTSDFVETPDPAAPWAAGLSAYSLLEETTFEQYIDSLELDGLVSAPVSDPNLGGQSAMTCGTPEATVCLVAWNRGDLVLSMQITGPAAQLNAQTARQLHFSLIPEIVLNLGNYRTGDSTATPAPGVPTTPSAPTVAPATTVAVGGTPTTLPPAAPTVTVAVAPTVPAVGTPTTTPGVPTPTTVPSGSTTSIGPTVLNRSSSNPPEVQAVFDAALAADTARLIAYSQPNSPAAESALTASHVAGSPADVEVREGMAYIAAEGLTIRVHPTIPYTFQAESLQFAPGTPATSATVSVCIVDSLALLDRTGSVVDDVVYAHRATFVMANEGGTWKLSERFVVEEFLGSTGCGAPGTGSVPKGGVTPAAAPQRPQSA